MSQRHQHAAAANSNEATISIPSVVVFLGLLFLTIRYFFFSSSSTGSAATSSSGNRRGAPAVSLEKIDHLAQMFPQLTRRDIEWDLLQNGGNVQTTSERVLREGRLHPAPPNFRAQPDPATTAAASTTGRTGGRGRGTDQPNLITRYNLASRLNDASSGAGSGDKSKGKGRANELDSRGGVSQTKSAWSTNKTERQTMLQRRREEMVLAARRKMEEQDSKNRQ